jgi:hypothetical protein
MGNKNLAKLTDIRVRFTDPTQTSIAEGEKGDVEVCAIDDERAMTLNEYMAMKNWVLN